MKKLFLLIAVAAFMFACGGGAATQSEGCASKAKSECADHIEGEGCKAKSKCEKEGEGCCKKDGEKKEGCDKK
jgi:hypothetical protein